MRVLVSTLTHSRCSYPSRSDLLCKPRPHVDHINVHIYIDVLHEDQVVVHADCGYTLVFAEECAKSNLHLCASNVHFDLLHSYDTCAHTPYHPLVLELGST
jgi:hypothetical protein